MLAKHLKWFIHIGNLNSLIDVATTELIQIDNRRTSSRKKSAFALKEKLSGSTASISAIDTSKIANDEFEKAYQKPHKGQYAQISIESEKHEMIGADTKTPTVEDDEYLDELDKDRSIKDDDKIKKHSVIQKLNQKVKIQELMAMDEGCGLMRMVLNSYESFSMSMSMPPASTKNTGTMAIPREGRSDSLLVAPPTIDDSDTTISLVNDGNSASGKDDSSASSLYLGTVSSISLSLLMGCLFHCLYFLS